MKTKTKIAILTYTYWRDAHRANVLHNNIPTTYKSISGEDVQIDKFWVIEKRDEKLASLKQDEDTKIIIKDFNRGFGLNGLACVIAMSEIYLNLFREYDAVLKLDSDTVLFNWKYVIESFLNGADAVGALRFEEERNKRSFNGCFYGLGKRVAPAIANLDAGAEVIREIEAHIPEDIYFSYIIRKCIKNLIVNDLGKSKTYMCCSPNLNSDCNVAHFGYVDNKRIVEDLKTIENNIVASGKSLSGFKAPEMDDFDKFIGLQKQIAPNRNVEPYACKYDRDGKEIMQKENPKNSIPAGSVLLGYDKETSEPIYRVPEKISCQQGLLPLPKNQIDLLQRRPIVR